VMRRLGGSLSWLVLPRRYFSLVAPFVAEAVPQAVVSQAIDVTRLAAFAPALQRRLLRFAVGQLGAAPDFEATESLRTLSLSGRAGQKLELAQGLRAERTPRELRLTTEPTAEPLGNAGGLPPEYRGTIPGQIAAAAFGLILRIDVCPSSSPPGGQRTVSGGIHLTLRNWRSGDRVTLRYSSGPRKVKEVLERMKVTGTSRNLWPVLEQGGRIIWMRGVELEPVPGIVITVSFT
jgi:tRNA(Ile)-lysidine synthase